MRTLVFKTNTSEDDAKQIKVLQNEYSCSFRKQYANLELMKDAEFIKSLSVKSKKQIDYLQKEVVAFYDRNTANKLKIQSNITKLLGYSKLSLKQFKRLNKLKKSLNKKVCFGSTTELVKLSKGTGDLTKWQNSRLLPLIFYGETARFGNRFFDLKTIASGNIVFKLESTKIKIPINFNPKKHLNTLIHIQQQILDRALPVTVKLTSDKLYITYDESMLNNTKLDIKAFYVTIKDVKDKDERRGLIAARHKSHEADLKYGKLDRYLSVDLNPDGFGYSVLNKDLSVVDKGFIDLSSLYGANKRKYETTIVVKELFKIIKHYRCHSIVLEELNIKNTDLGNRVSNRKCNNLWNRGLIAQLIQRRCNETGTLKIEINPVYTSFIGNVQHNEYDPIAASLEIGRKGILKYSKGSFYPEFSSNSFINDQMYDEIRLCQTWKDLYGLFVTSKRSYRRKLEQFNFIGYDLGNEKSGVKHLHFQ